MDISVRQELSTVIEQLTHSGSATLDQELMKKVKRMCKSSEMYVRTAYELVMSHLSKDHAEIRLSSFQVASELFTRSAVFRELLIADFQKWTRLVTETDPLYPLPMPKAAAVQLKKQSLLAIRQWHEKYGEGYTKLKLGYNYLKFNKKVNFEELVAQTEATRRRRDEREVRRRAILQQRIQEVKQEMNDMRLDIEGCLIEVESCFNLLLPRFDIPDIYTAPETSNTQNIISSASNSPGTATASRHTPSSSNSKPTSISGSADLKTSSQSDSELEPNPQPDLDSELEPNPQPDFDSELEPNPQPDLHSKLEPNPQPDLDSELGQPLKEISKTQAVLGPMSSSRERVRRRTVSSGSFVSLSSGSEIDSDSDDEEATNPLSTVEKTPDPTDDASRLISSSTDEGAEDFIRRVYGVHRPESGDQRGSKLSAKTRASSKGKEKMPVSIMNTDQSKDGGRISSSEDEAITLSNSERMIAPLEEYSDSDSEVEWEDVTTPSPINLPTDLDLQEHGFSSHGFSIPIELSSTVEIRETEDNSSILATLRECWQLLRVNYLPTITKWMEWMSKAGEEDSLRAAIDLKTKVNSSLGKFKRLNIVYKEPHHPKKQQSSSEHEINKTDSSVVAKPKITHPEWKFGTELSSIPAVDLELDPTTPHAQFAKLRKKLKDKSIASNRPASKSKQSDSNSTPDQEKTSVDSRQKLLARAPVVPFGIDLHHWENQTTPEAMTLAPVGSLHRFWVQETELNISQDEKDRLKCRTISFPGKFEPVQKSCRALLPSGKLCPRKDRFKCPFHGPIIPRDEHGNPVRPTTGSHSTTSRSAVINSPLAEQLLGAAGVQCSSSEAADDLWQDIQLQSAGIMLPSIDVEHQDQPTTKKKRKGRGKKSMAVKYPGLTDLKMHKDTPRKRLERKVLSKQSLRRVADAMDTVTAKKYHDKFGYNFNYALKK